MKTAIWSFVIFFASKYFIKDLLEFKEIGIEIEIGEGYVLDGEGIAQFRSL